MNEFLTEKGKKSGAIKRTLCGIAAFMSLAAFAAGYEFISEKSWNMMVIEWVIGLLLLYPTFREIQKGILSGQAGKVAQWFSAYAESTITFSKLETEMKPGAVKNIQRLLSKGYLKNRQIDKERSFITITAPNHQVKKHTYITVICPCCGGKNQIIQGRLTNCEYCGQPLE